jgi:hypothetical protein
MDIREQCRERAIQFAKDWESEFPNVTDHNIEMMVSIMCTRDKSSYPGGGFVEAVCANNLYQAISRADSSNLKVLKLLVLCHRNCYINE